MLIKGKMLLTFVHAGPMDAEDGENRRPQPLVREKHEAGGDDALQQLGVQAAVEVAQAELSHQVDHRAGHAGLT